MPLYGCVFTPDAGHQAPCAIFSAVLPHLVTRPVHPLTTPPSPSSAVLMASRGHRTPPDYSSLMTAAGWTGLHAGSWAAWRPVGGRCCGPPVHLLTDNKICRPPVRVHVDASAPICLAVRFLLLSGASWWKTTVNSPLFPRRHARLDASLTRQDLNISCYSLLHFKCTVTYKQKHSSIKSKTEQPNS